MSSYTGIHVIKSFTCDVHKATLASSLEANLGHENLAQKLSKRKKSAMEVNSSF